MAGASRCTGRCKEIQTCWLIEIGRGVASRLTFNSSNDGFPLWFPNGRRIVFGSEPKGTYDLVVKSLSDGDDEQPLLDNRGTEGSSGMVGPMASSCCTRRCTRR